MSKLVKNDSEWKKLLNEESYRVTRQSGTERPFTGKYWDFDKQGVYKCICCGEKLFESKTIGKPKSHPFVSLLFLITDL